MCIFTRAFKSLIFLFLRSALFAFLPKVPVQETPACYWALMPAICAARPSLFFVWVGSLWWTALKVKHLFPFSHRQVTQLMEVISVFFDKQQRKYKFSFYPSPFFCWLFTVSLSFSKSFFLYPISPQFYFQNWYDRTLVVICYTRFQSHPKPALSKGWFVCVSWDGSNATGHTKKWRCGLKLFRCGYTWKSGPGRGYLQVKIDVKLGAFKWCWFCQMV